MTSTILLRHGQSTFNAAYDVTGRDPGHIDAPLTALGRDQAARARAELADTPFDLVVCSPLTRALQTMQAVFGDRDIPVLVTCRHREKLDGPSDVGRSPGRLKQDFPHLAFDHLDDPWWHHAPAAPEAITAEPHAVFEQRVASFRAWLAGHAAQRIAVVGHATFFFAMTGQWLANCETLPWSPEGMAAKLPS